MHVTRGFECPPESGAAMSFNGMQFGTVSCGSRTGFDAAKPSSLLYVQALKFLETKATPPAARAARRERRVRRATRKS